MSRLKVALDATYSLGPNLSGVGVYSREILHGLARSGGADWLWCYRPHRLLKSFRESIPAGCRRRPLLENRVPSCDLFHGLNQRLPSARPKRTVVTFHDLFMLTADYSSPEFRARFTKQTREAAARADLIIAVSRFTAGQVQALLNVEISRLRVVPHGVQYHPEQTNLLREDLILCVGAVQKRKNSTRLVEAFEQTPPGWRLVFAGSMGFDAEKTKLRAEASPRRNDILFTGWIDDVRLADLYRRARIFAFPSLDEGFGMPILEAMSSGVPVITSNCSAMPEVAGGAALLVDPTDTGQLATALRSLAQDEPLRNKLIAAGRERAAGFPWDNAVSQTWAVYRELLR